MAIQNNLKIHDSACISRPHCSAIKVQPNLLSFPKIFLRLRNLAWDFFGLFKVQGVFWVLLEALGTFLGLDIWPHLIIPVT